ncbi:ATP-binding protein [Albimonas sp. CAU 1670]|uniref:ATP-binding protein n=1 Tax=Albimonas sp. CAU 1670 TaxID=3032599 RepID=UPI0023DB8AD7|nr:ATP-binding protein [Albimonas sp. CAU 1670]MDF2231081.1 ATP-binding protein [Albimonas sp. CAU 1670]
MAKAYKKYLPRSLFGRALLILLAPIVLLQLVVAGLFIQNHYAGVTQQMAGSVALELIYAVNAVESAPDVEGARIRLENIARPLGMTLALDPGATVSEKNAQLFYDVSGNALAERLRAEIARPIAIDLVRYNRDVEVKIQTEKGVIRALIPRKRTIASNPHILLVWMVATAFLLAVVAVLFLRNQVKPIRQLANAAEGFGRGRVVPFRPAGAEEVRRAGAAFLDMRRRVERAMEQRTNMLYGVSHDLRTPLTRMRLAVEMLDDSPDRDDLAKDIHEMERMLGEFLDFARGGAGETASEADPLELLEAAAADARRAGADVRVSLAEDSRPPEPVTLRAGAISRALGNLLSNAARYGDHVEARMRLGRLFVEWSVEDDGPGIPEDKRETALRPFSRLDESRNQNEGGGVGLGLAIALDIARAHGGALTLESSETLGGLRVVLRIPR